jgi:hypothetical protein
MLMRHGTGSDAIDDGRAARTVPARHVVTCRYEAFATAGARERKELGTGLVNAIKKDLELK